MPFTKASNKIYAYEITSSCGSRSATSQELQVLHNVSFLLPKNNVIFISSFDRARYSGENFIIESYSGENKLERRVYAEKGYFKDNELILENVVVHKFSDGRVSMEALPQEKYSVPSLQKYKYGQQQMPFLLFDTAEVMRLEEMNFAELRKRIKLLELYGRGNIKEKINYYLRFAYPMLNFVFILFSIPVGLTYRVKGLRNVGLGVLVSFFWWGLSSVMSAFAEKGSVHPIASAFLPDAVFLVISIIMIKRVLKR
jgi:lipopolysaccharide export LptBFGC system permease protein LptF